MPDLSQRPGVLKQQFLSMRSGPLPQPLTPLLPFHAPPLVLGEAPGFGFAVRGILRDSPAKLAAAFGNLIVATRVDTVEGGNVIEEDYAITMAVLRGVGFAPRTFTVASGGVRPFNGSDNLFDNFRCRMGRGRLRAASRFYFIHFISS